MASACVFPPPGHLNITTGNVAENFKLWKRQFEIYLKASKNDAAAVDGETKVAILLACAGPDTIKVFDQLEFTQQAHKNDVHQVLKYLEKYCAPMKNEVVSSHKFWSLEYYGPFDKFLTDLRLLAAECNFGNFTNRLIRDKLVFVTKGRLQARLLRETDLDLEKAIGICRADEMAEQHGKEFEKQRNIDKVKVKSAKSSTNKSSKPPKKQTTSTTSIPMLKYDCRFCGKKHLANKESCPAYGVDCHKCGEGNHFSKLCPKKKKVQTVNQQEADSNDSSDDSDDQEAWLGAVQSTGRSTIRAKMIVNDCEVNFEIDSGAEVNIIKQKYVRKSQVRPAKLNLTMWNHSSEKPLGEAYLDVTNPKTGESTKANFIVVSNKFNNLLGVTSVQEMTLITVNRGNFNVGQVSVSDLGDLGEVHLYTDSDVQPRTLPCRTVPIALRDRVKEELDRLTSIGVIEPVDKPTEWVSQMAVVEKANGSLRICVDPQPLNVALKREHYKLPTFDEVIPRLTNAKVFSRLDVESAFWHVKLDEASSDLTTMTTPFGRYRWKRLPFGLKVSSEIFQKRLLQALEGLSGVLCVADDIVVIGQGDDLEAAKRDHKVNLQKLQERCKDKNIKLNDKKSDIEKSSITFMGHTISDQGVSPDPKKVKAVQEMPKPTDPSSVRRLCGCVQYLSRFLPNLADDLKPLRRLTCDDVPWNWTAECDQALEKVKRKITDTPVLTFYDPSKELVVQVDSSKDGIGAALLQDGKPIEYASRTMTSTEERYAQIEKECLAVVFGLERFDQYTYGREVVVQNDHKPLASILQKPLSQSPKRLQSMILRIRRYDIKFQYLEGKKLVLADTLSRAALTTTSPKVHSVDVLKHVPISDKRLEELRCATEKDAVMQTLAATIQNGWPEKVDDVDMSIKVYFDVRDTLTTCDGLILKGERLVIPQSMRCTVKERLHSAHLGYDSMMRRARDLVFWPGMKKDIKQLADSCEICLEAKPRNQKETLIQHAPSSEPWEKLGMDLFTIENKNYLVTVDYYSNFWEVDLLPTTTSKVVIKKLKGHFARYGIPKEIVSDNGPQFSSAEFKDFAAEFGINHHTSSPGHPKSNGKAEAAVKAAKTLMKKAVKDNSDQHTALLELRNTPLQSHGKSPAQLLFNRRTRTLLPSTQAVLKPTRPPNITKDRATRNKSVKRHYDKSAKDMKRLSKGDEVWIYPIDGGRSWTKGTVTGQHDDRSYEVQEGNHLYRRNRVHLRPAGEQEGAQDEPAPADTVPEIPEAAQAPVPAPERRGGREKRPPTWMKDYVEK